MYIYMHLHIHTYRESDRNIILLEQVVNLRGQSMIRYSLPPPRFSESGIHLASATDKPLGFLWIHVQGFIK